MLQQIPSDSLTEKVPQDQVRDHGRKVVEGTIPWLKHTVILRLTFLKCFTLEEKIRFSKF